MKDEQRTHPLVTRIIQNWLASIPRASVDYEAELKRIARAIREDKITAQCHLEVVLKNTNTHN